jgi:hypothetical protein
MAKDRERVHLKRELPMPQSRNERRQLGDGSKEVDKAVERAGRKGLLISRSSAQIDKKLSNIGKSLACRTHAGRCRRQCIL